MSLDFQLGAIKGWEDLCRGGSPTGPLNKTTEAIVFACMSVGIGTITQENFVEFYERMVCCYALSEFNDPSQAPSLKDVRAHIGLRTNVSNDTRNQWVKRVFEGTAMTLRYNLRRDDEAAEKKVEEPA